MSTLLDGIEKFLEPEPIPEDSLGRVMALKTIMVSRATGTYPDDRRYEHLRKLVVTDPRIKQKLPAFLADCTTLGEFWSFISPCPGQSEGEGKYEARRRFLQEQFQPAIAFLEGRVGGPDDDAISDTPNDSAREMRRLNQPAGRAGAVETVPDCLEAAQITMDKLTEIRQRLSSSQREMLNAIWGHRREHGHWLPRRRLHHRFVDRLQVNEVQAALEQLGGCVVFENRDDDKDCYALTFLGVLMTDQGPDLEDLCIRYLEYVRDLYLGEPDTESVSSKEVQAGLGISPEEAQVLGGLIGLGHLYSRYASGLGGSEWSAGVPDDVDTFPHCQDLRSHLRRQALRSYEQAVPITETALMQYWLRKTGMSQSAIADPVVAVPGEHEVTSSVETEKYDAFICHATEDKAAVAAPLAQALQARGLRVWYDQWALTIGDSLRESIDKGLARSHYGIVVLSPTFFKRNWPKWELNGLHQKQLNGRKVILPIWHDVTHSGVAGYSPSLADLVAGNTEEGIEAVADKLVAVLQSDR